MKKYLEFLNHIKTWNRWRKINGDGPFHKFLVLIGFIHSPTFGLMPDIENFMKELIKNEHTIIECECRDIGAIPRIQEKGVEDVRDN